MMKLNYAQQIKHPMWQKKRLEVLEDHGFECENCGSKENELHVHHPFYRKGAMIWQYETEELQCLCNKCHKEEHALDERIKKALSILGSATKHQVLGYIESIHGITPLYPDTYEYCVGVADFASYVERPQKFRNQRTDKITHLITSNKGKDGLDILAFLKKGGKSLV